MAIGLPLIPPKLFEAPSCHAGVAYGVPGFVVAEIVLHEAEVAALAGQQCRRDAAARAGGWPQSRWTAKASVAAATAPRWP